MGGGGRGWGMYYLKALVKAVQKIPFRDGGKVQLQNSIEKVYENLIKRHIFRTTCGGI